MKKFMQTLLPYMMASALINAGNKEAFEKNIEIDPELEKERKISNKLQRQKKNGLQEFTIDGVTVLALNYKNAVKKVNKLK